MNVDGTFGRSSAKLARLLVAAALSLAGFQAHAAEPVSWGIVENGIRIGLSLNGSSPDGVLKVTLENVDSSEKDIYLAFGIVSRFKFSATSPDGKVYPITDRNLFVPVSLSMPVVEHIGPQASRQYTFPLERLLYIPPKGNYLSLDKLMRLGYSIRTGLEVSEQQLQSDGVQAEDGAWIGHVASGSIHRN